MKFYYFSFTTQHVYARIYGKPPLDLEYYNNQGYTDRTRTHKYEFRKVDYNRLLIRYNKNRKTMRKENQAATINFYMGISLFTRRFGGETVR